MNYKPMNGFLEEEYAVFVENLGVERSLASKGSDPHTSQMSFVLLHMAMGLVTEASEVMDLLKKHMAYNRPLDRKKLVDELGDVLFYLVGALIDQGLTLEDVIKINMAKLKTRYPDGYNHQSANNRNLELEEKMITQSMITNVDGESVVKDSKQNDRYGPNAFTNTDYEGVAKQNEERKRT